MKTLILVLAFALTASAQSTFLLFNNDGSFPQDIEMTTDSIANSNFDETLPTKFVVHGFEESAFSEVVSYIAQGKYAEEKSNIILVDWTQALTQDMCGAYDATVEVGKEIANAIDFLNENFGLKFNTLELIGHKMGAHIASFAAKNVNNGKVNSILALDPTFQLKKWKKNNTLISSDATHVEVLRS